jgi:transcriptional regulator with XRE-family HTH domain
LVRASSAATTRAIKTLGSIVAAERREQRRPQTDLAARAGISVSTLSKIEHGDPGVAIGAAFEIAVLLGIELFPEIDDTALAQRVALVPAAVRQPRPPAREDF